MAPEQLRSLWEDLKQLLQGDCRFLLKVSVQRGPMACSPDRLPFARTTRDTQLVNRRGPGVAPRLSGENHQSYRKNQRDALRPDAGADSSSIHDSDRDTRDISPVPVIFWASSRLVERTPRCVSTSR
ncbi:hypothetical protein EYF80_027063 [Liparis tanakae]|uniref:Uncharacterized protein n=1 Tax=Liparis tanakae TaxID=230148 RepID=A0A4Z2HAT0_9TELE|nr:hypothetical protein EYF80_027063 [Liparis tanakae]